MTSWSSAPWPWPRSARASCRSEEHTSELQSPCNLVCRLLLEKKNVSHGHISVANEIVSVPSYIVKRDEESRIAFDQRSPLTNAQHPALAAPEGKRLAPVIEKSPIAAPAIPALPVVSPEIKD